jgi:hypothetical protein
MFFRHSPQNSSQHHFCVIPSVFEEFIVPFHVLRDTRVFALRPLVGV